MQTYVCVVRGFYVLLIIIVKGLKRFREGDLFFAHKNLHTALTLRFFFTKFNPYLQT